MTTVPILDADGARRDLEVPLVPGRSAATTSRPVALSTEDYAALSALVSAILTAGTSGTPATAVLTMQGISGMTPMAVQDYTALGEYETVAASQTTQVLGGAGAVGDYLSGLLIQPATISPGAVTLFDGLTQIYQFPGGAASVNALIPFFVPFSSIRSVEGPFKITTGTNVSVLATGNFS